MKRFLALAALVLGMVSCQTEPEGLDVIVGGEQEVMVNVALPEGTRASSADGFDLNSLATTDYSLRYILEIYLKNEQGEVLYDKCQRHVKVSDDTSVAFPVRLAQGRDYQVTVWADIVEDGSEADRYYNTAAGLDAISIGTWNAMDETRDAYTGSKGIDDFNGSPIDLILKRPFAKVRVVATDIDDIRAVGLEPTTAAVVYQSMSMYQKFNAVSGIASAAGDKSHNYAYATTATKYTDVDGEMTLFADYIFVPESGTVQFTIDVKDQATRSIKFNNFNTDIYVEANKLTTIKGDVLTIGGNVKVTVDNELGVKDVINIVDTPNSLIDAIEDAQPGEETNIELGGDIDLSDLFGAGILSTRAAEPTYGLLIPADSKVVLDLNGFTIRQTKEQTGAYQMIQNNGILTIKDGSAAKTGKLVYCDRGNGGNYVSNTIQNSGVLTIESGTIENNSGSNVASNGYPHPIDNSGTLTINGGTFTNAANYSSMRIWCTTDDDTIVTINGGTFNGSIDFQTPNASANKGTLTIKGGIFNADTYTNTAVRLLGFGADVDEMNGYIEGGVFNGAIALKNWSGGEFNSKVFDITGGTFTVDPSEFVDDDYKVKNENGVCTLEQKPVIVKIGNTEYRSLNKAVAAANEGETIVFVADVEQADGVIITDKNITIDLNDKTFTVTNGANTNNRNFKVNGTSVVTIKNGTMVAAGEYSTGAYGTLRTEGTANVTLEDVELYSYRGSGLNVKVCTGTTVTINNSEIYSQYGGGVEAAGGTVVLNDVTIDQKGVYSGNAWCSVAIGVNGNGKVTVNSGDYSASAISTDANAAQGTWVAYVMSSGGTLDIKGGTFNGVVAETAAAANACGLICADRAAVVEIHGGTFNSNGAILDMRNNVGTQPNPKATLFGGTFSADPRVSGLYASNLITVAAGYKVVENNGRWAVVVDPVAKIGDVEYATLQEAFNVGGEITLLRNVAVAETVVLAEGKTVVLDLNGKTLSVADKNVIRNDGGNLTIMNGTVTRTGDVVGYSVNNASGEITVENATIECGLYTSGSKMTATNANISHEQSSRHAIYAWNCEVTINSGTFHNDNAGNATLMAAGSSVVTINGGTFSIADGRSTLGWTSSMIDQKDTAQVIVKGGLFNGGFRINSADTTLTIEGGEFNTNNGSAFTDYSGTKVVRGGKFTDAGAQNWAKKYIADGYEMDANGQVVAK